jgi:glycosyltransferase involved in cell wall biosynthesis
VRVKISLIVCTRNRARRLPEFLSRISRLQFPSDDWELVLVDHASIDDTPSVIGEFIAGVPAPVRRLRSAARCLSEAKNEAIAVARGDILAFTDDDCYPTPEYLRALVEVFDEHRIGVVGGRVLLHDPTDASLSVRDVETPTDIAPRTFVRAGIVHGNCMAVSREVVRAVGGFDPLFGPGSPCVAAEDVEYVARAVWAGWRARFDPRPVVAHHHGKKPGAEAERHRRGYDYGRGAYYAKFAMNSQAGPVYLRHWFGLARRARGRGALGRLMRELAGGRQYLQQRLLHPQPIPQFSTIGVRTTRGDRLQHS